jgi:hypothetical protein
MLDTIKANPIPAALTAVGIGWMLMHRGSDSSHGSQYGRDNWGSQETGYGSRSFDAYGAGGMRGQSTGQQAQQMAGQFATQVQDRAGQMQHQLENTADQMQHRLGGTAEQVQEQAQGFWQTLQANPVAAAALGLGLGAIAGVAIPESEKENQLMGETRDRVVGNVQQVAGEKLDQAQHIAKEARTAAMEEAKSQVKSHGMMSGSSSTSASSSTA